MSTQRVPLICGGHSRPIPHLSFSPVLPGDEDVYIVSGCLDGKAMLRNGRSGDWIGTLQGHKGAVWCARINRNATKIFTGSADFSLKMWCAITGTELGTIDHQHVVKAVDLSPDERQVLSAGLDKKIKLWDVESNESIATLAGGHERGISTAIWLSPSTILAGGGEPGVRVWDTRSGDVVKVLETTGEKKVKSLERSREGIISCAAGRTAMFFSTDSLSLENKYTYDGDINWVTLHPGDVGNFVVAHVDGFRVMLYNYEDGSEISRLSGHHGPPHCVRWAPDGKYFASGSDDGTIRLWRNVKEVEEEQIILRQKMLEEAERKKAEAEAEAKRKKEEAEAELKKAEAEAELKKAEAEAELKKAEAEAELKKEESQTDAPSTSTTGEDDGTPTSEEPSSSDAIREDAPSDDAHGGGNDAPESTTHGASVGDKREESLEES